MPMWAVGLGVLATVIVARRAATCGSCRSLRGARACGVRRRYDDRLSSRDLAGGDSPPAPVAAGGLFGALDVMSGYQATWLLMFADYSRYNRPGRASAVAVFLGLALTGAGSFRWASRQRPSRAPTIRARWFRRLGLGWWGALFVTMATLTTNFVNIYMSALALKSLRPSTPDAAGVWLIGGVGAALSVLSTAWLNQLRRFHAAARGRCWCPSAESFSPTTSCSRDSPGRGSLQRHRKVRPRRRLVDCRRGGVGRRSRGVLCRIARRRHATEAWPSRSLCISALARKP